MSSHELPPIELKLATDAPSVAVGAPVSAKQNLMDLELSADALAHTDCEIFSLPHGELRRLMDSHPSLCAKFLWAFGRKLSHRLRETNQRMALFAASRAF